MAWLLVESVEWLSESQKHGGRGQEFNLLHNDVKIRTSLYLKSKRLSYINLPLIHSIHKLTIFICCSGHYTF